jgi:hypothetical protein
MTSLGSRALATGRKNKTRLVIAKLDRLFRNVVLVAALMDSGIEFVAVDNLHYPHACRLTLPSGATLTLVSHQLASAS